MVTDRDRLGASPEDGGTHFALRSENAQRVELCLFNRADSAEPRRRLPLSRGDDHIWRAFVPEVGPGALYGYRVGGPYDVDKGLRFNPHKLLADPCADAFIGKHDWEGEMHFDYRRPLDGEKFVPDMRPNDARAPKCVVVDHAFDWQGVAPPDHPAERLVIYETHLKGFTAHPSSGVATPGTYVGFIEKIGHLRDLGVTAVELLPIHETGHEHHLALKGLTNYWGYATLGYFAPDQRFAADASPGAAVREFKTLVRELHRAGIEVILDVVYNHTCEGNRLGPTFAFRGIDNSVYYALDPKSLRTYRDVTGCGNMLNVAHPAVRRMIVDSLRHFATAFRIDGFRFDLAVTLARNPDEFDPAAPLLTEIANDPVLRGKKLIVEPWDLGPNGFRLGGFPPPYAEWNSRYKIVARRIVRGERGLVGELAYRIGGSEDLFGESRTPRHAVNYVTAHDGFTLADLTSYEQKRNEANLEDNRDGENQNHASGWGAEGPTDDASIRAARGRARKNLLALLFVSQGIPMVLGGDEIGRTQRGNNNAYCQDNEISWFDWNGPSPDETGRFLRRLIDYRLRHAAFCRPSFFDGEGALKTHFDIRWIGANGRSPDWRDGNARFLGFLLDGRAATGPNRPDDDDHLVLVNMGDARVDLTLPETPNDGVWRLVFDTSRIAPGDFPGDDEPLEIHRAASVLSIPPKSVIALRSLMRRPESTTGASG
ncbi:glycogen debranching protein GlgX [bacterium]|nr:glycogen debranching protein GlgX [bacterium]